LLLSKQIMEMLSTVGILQSVEPVMMVAVGFMAILLVMLADEEQ
jgi:hypothetical protein